MEKDWGDNPLIFGDGMPLDVVRALGECYGVDACGMLAMECFIDEANGFGDGNEMAFNILAPMIVSILNAHIAKPGETYRLSGDCCVELLRSNGIDLPKHCEEL